MTCDPVERSDHPLLLFFYSLVFLVGLILNSFTLWFHCCGAHRQVSKSLTIYLKHLTAADFLLCISLPMRIIYYSTRSFTVHLFYCGFGSAFLYLNIITSIMFMGYIAANRYMKIFYSSETSFLMTTKASHIISMTTWFVPLTLMTSYSILLLITYKPHPYLTTCGFLLSDRVNSLHSVMHCFAAFVFMLVLLSLVFFYYNTCRRVRQIQQRQLGSNSKRLLKSRRNMLVLVSVFCFCFVPFHLIQLPYFLFGGHCSEVFYYLKEVTLLMSVCNICLDPLIYLFFCKDFKSHLKEMFCMKGKKNTST
ncbi:P2Y purinoceptor 14-like [Cyprinodon tularosa]|uniref:P2Y purinoceptor 14-like n=1 Tax=Cyprinodon tularosa TaxID=77115 RepID=UPI0018E282D1|nr:P2Y purinoceptor 14-like [Cyprinodon tularosa]